MREVRCGKGPPSGKADQYAEYIDMESSEYSRYVYYGSGWAKVTPIEDYADVSYDNINIFIEELENL